MSHIVTLRTQVRDAAALAAACRRLGWPDPVHGTAYLYSGQVQGHCVSVRGWRHPVVFNLETAEVRYDNFGGAWGAMTELERLLQAYAVEKTHLEARRAGHTVTEQALPDGSIQLTLAVGGA
jgi:hypothetical protein